MIIAASIVGLIAYYSITRAILLWYAVVIRGLDIDYSKSGYNSEESWRTWILTPGTGDFMFWIFGPVVLSIDLSEAFSDKMLALRRLSEAKAVTSAKLSKMKSAQLELAEIQLDRELSQAKKEFRKYHGEME